MSEQAPTYPVKLDFSELSSISDSLEREIVRNNKRVERTFAKRERDRRQENIRQDARAKVAKAESALRKVDRAICEHSRQITEALKADAERVPECAKGDACELMDWQRTTEPCTHGHFDCSTVAGGTCMDEHSATFSHPSDDRHDVDLDDAIFAAERYGEPIPGARS